jgi:hypothetical protein
VAAIRDLGGDTPGRIKAHVDGAERFVNVMRLSYL